MPQQRVHSAGHNTRSSSRLFGSAVCPRAQVLGLNCSGRSRSRRVRDHFEGSAERRGAGRSAPPAPRSERPSATCRRTGARWPTWATAAATALALCRLRVRPRCTLAPSIVAPVTARSGAILILASLLHGEFPFVAVVVRGSTGRRRGAAPITEKITLLVPTPPAKVCLRGSGCGLRRQRPRRNRAHARGRSRPPLVPT